MQSLTPSDPRQTRETSGSRGLVPLGARAVERVLGRPPAYYRRKGRILWAVWRKPVVWSLAAAMALVVGFTGAGLPFRSAVTDTANGLILASGLRIGSIVIEGEDGIPDADVIEALSLSPDTPLPFFDVAAARKRLMAIPRVRSATVQKLYPDTLHLKIEEREPFALWQRTGRVSVIDQDGRVVRDEPNDEQIALPLFVGEGANVAAHALETALNEKPRVKSRVSAAVRVADRRWTLKLDNGVDVRLPEVDAERALAALSTMLRQPRFFDQPIQTIDLRLADRVTLTLTEDGAVTRRALIKQRNDGAKERQT